MDVLSVSWTNIKGSAFWTLHKTCKAQHVQASGIPLLYYVAGTLAQSFSVSSMPIPRSPRALSHPYREMKPHQGFKLEEKLKNILEGSDDWVELPKIFLTSPLSLKFIINMAQEIALIKLFRYFFNKLHNEQNIFFLAPMFWHFIGRRHQSQKRLLILFIS